MNNYEVCVVLNATLTDEQIDELIEKLRGHGLRLLRDKLRDDRFLDLIEARRLLGFALVAHSAEV